MKNNLKRIPQYILSLIFFSSFLSLSISSVVRAEALRLPLTSEVLRAYYSDPYPQFLNEKSLPNIHHKKLQPLPKDIYLTAMKTGRWWSDEYFEYYSNKTPNIQFFEIGEFMLYDLAFKVIAYLDYVEADTPGLIIQLNSYTKKGVFIDALLLDQRIQYEEGENYSRFYIDQQGNVTINQYQVTHAEITDGGIGDPIDHALPYIEQQRSYKISQEGKFIARDVLEFPEPH